MFLIVMATSLLILISHQSTNDESHITPMLYIFYSHSFQVHHSLRCIHSEIIIIIIIIAWLCPRPRLAACPGGPAPGSILAFPRPQRCTPASTLNLSLPRGPKVAQDKTLQAPKTRFSATPPPSVRVSALLWGDLPLDGLSPRASVYPFSNWALFPRCLGDPRRDVAGLMEWGSPAPGEIV